MENPIEEIKNRLDIVEVIGSYLKLEKAGANYRAICPFHSEKKPSFFVSPARQIWHCFGCGRGGDIFGFIKEIEGVEFGDALRILAKKAGVELKRLPQEAITKRKRLEEMLELSCRFFQTQLEKSAGGKKAKDYLLERKISPESIQKWRLGWAPNNFSALSDFLLSRGYKKDEIEETGLAYKNKNGNLIDRFRSRIMFPVFNLQSQVIGYGGRIFGTDDVAKYINTPNTLLYDKSKALYGLDKARLEIRKKDFVIVVEGYVDCVLSHQAGFENTVAVSGTALSVYHLKMLQRYTNNLYFAFDMDIGGETATQRAIFLSQKMGFDIKVLILPKDKDPADIITQNPGDWEKIVLAPKPILDYFFELFLLKFDKESLSGKKEIIKNFLPFLKEIQNEIEKSFWIEKLAGELNIKEEDIRKELSKIKISKDDEKDILQEQNLKIPKSRKDLLEERLLSLLLRNQNFLDKIKEDEECIFSKLGKEILVFLKEKKQEECLSDDAKQFYNYLLLKSEIENVEPNLVFREIEFCKNEIENIVAREELEKISQELKKAEAENDAEKLKQLIEQFNFWSKKIIKK